MKASVVKSLWGVRYQVKDVSRSVNFYTQHLGLKLDQQNLPAFAQVSVGNLKLILSGPGASGSRAMPDGRQQTPGGWNRIILEVDDLERSVRRTLVVQANLNPGTPERAWFFSLWPGVLE